MTAHRRRDSSPGGRTGVGTADAGPSKVNRTDDAKPAESPCVAAETLWTPIHPRRGSTAARERLRRADGPHGGEAVSGGSPSRIVGDVAVSVGSVLTEAQLDTLRAHGDER